MQQVEFNRVVEEILNRLTVEMEASGRHVHLSRSEVDYLFGQGYQLTPVKELSQPGQYACAERVTLFGPKGEFHNVAILGPERKEAQAEISLSDAVKFGVKPPVRMSGDTAGTPGFGIRYGNRELRLDHGLIVAKRHIHMTPEDARRFGVSDKQIVQLKTFTNRPRVFGEVVVRVSDQFATYVHLDHDEANACGFQKGDRAAILTTS